MSGGREVFVVAVEEAAERCAALAKRDEDAHELLPDQSTAYAKALRDLAAAHRAAELVYRKHRSTYR